MYADRGSHYLHTPVAVGPIDRNSTTQIGRVLAQLGVERIAAYYPSGALVLWQNPMQTFVDTLPVAKEKLLQAA